MTTPDYVEQMHEFTRLAVESIAPDLVVSKAEGHGYAAMLVVYDGRIWHTMASTPADQPMTENQ